MTGAAMMEAVASLERRLRRSTIAKPGTFVVLGIWSLEWRCYLHVAGGQTQAFVGKSPEDVLHRARDWVDERDVVKGGIL